jgi:hypothetical protein
VIKYYISKRVLEKERKLRQVLKPTPHTKKGKGAAGLWEAPPSMGRGGQKGEATNKSYLLAKARGSLM